VQLSAFDGRPVVIGAGLAGLSTALHLSEHERVVVLAASPLGEGAASGWAQGGVAVALAENDSPDLHAADTLAAGDGLCDAEAVRRIVSGGPEAVSRLARLGARFDTATGGSPKLGLEAAHSRRRIVHAHGDGTGREILRALIAAVRGRTDRIALMERTEARRLLTDANGAIAGVLAADGSGRELVMRTSRVILATGGLGGLYAHTTNPPGALGRGLAMAARAGAALANMEFVQFHPTALDVGLDPMPLVSEAVRGEGAVLINSEGERLMAGFGRAELEPRDVVARAVWAELAAGRQVFLDARDAIGARFTECFPTVAGFCSTSGIDPARAPIPIRPAAHYHMGGAAVDARGRTSVEGLWACGEAASTGLHGANRLASNSLLEAAVCGAEVASDVAGVTPTVRRAEMQEVPHAGDPGNVRNVLDTHVGVLRNRLGLETAVAALSPIACGSGPSADAALVALFIASSALRREESRGGHARTDFPDRVPALAHGSLLTVADVLPTDAVAAAA
jgi:L-aspartate oxidase